MSCCININWNCLSPSKKNVDYIKEFVENINKSLKDFESNITTIVGEQNIKIDNLYKWFDSQGQLDLSELLNRFSILENRYYNIFTYTDSNIQSPVIDSKIILDVTKNITPTEPNKYYLPIIDFTSGILKPSSLCFQETKDAYLSNNGSFVNIKDSTLGKNFNKIFTFNSDGSIKTTKLFLGEDTFTPSVDLTDIDLNSYDIYLPVAVYDNQTNGLINRASNLKFESTVEEFCLNKKGQWLNIDNLIELQSRLSLEKDTDNLYTYIKNLSCGFFNPNSKHDSGEYYLLMGSPLKDKEYGRMGMSPIQLNNVKPGEDPKKKYLSCAGTWENVPSGDTGTSDDKNIIIETTYRDLKNLKALTALTPGVYYKITDYQTIVFSDTASSLGKPCPLIVQAVTNSLLSENAIMIVYGNVYYCKYCFDNDKDRFEFVNPYDTIIKSDAGIFYIRDTEQSGPIWRRLEEVSSIQNIIDQYGNNLNPSSEYIQTAKDYGQEEYLEGIDYFENYMYHTPTGFTYANASDNMITIQDTTNSGRIVEVYPTSKGVIYEMTDVKGNTLPYDFIHIIFWNNVVSTPAIEGYTFSTHESGGEYYYEECSSGSANIYKNTVTPVYAFSKFDKHFVQILNNIIYYFEDPNSEGSYYCSNVSFNTIQNTIFKNCYIKNLKIGTEVKNNNFENVTITNTSIGSDFSGNTINCEKINCSTFGNNVKNNYFMGNVLNSYIGNKVIDNKFSSLEECILEGNNVDIKSYYVIDTSLHKNMYVNLSGCKIGLNTSLITLGIRTASGSDAGTAFKYILDPSITGTSKTIYLRENLNTTTYTTIKNSTNISNVEVTAVTQ